MIGRTGFLGSLARAVFGGGRPDARLDVASQAPESKPPVTMYPTPSRGDASVADSSITAQLGEKILLAWLRNRYQLMFPFALDLARLDERGAELLVDAMVHAALVDGALDEMERKRIEGALDVIGGVVEKHDLLATALERPKLLNDVIAQVQDTQGAALVYAASLMAMDIRNPVNKSYLSFLALRLQLSTELTDSLEQRFRSAG